MAIGIRLAAIFKDMAGSGLAMTHLIHHSSRIKGGQQAALDVFSPSYPLLLRTDMSSPTCLGIGLVGGKVSGDAVDLGLDVRRTLFRFADVAPQR